jgi:molecular chaperone DnaK (HSP70)
MAPPCIGIDLGAAKTMVVGETGEIVRNELGGHSSASLVGFSGDERYVGEGAVAQLATNAKNTARIGERLHGRAEGGFTAFYAGAETAIADDALAAALLRNVGSLATKTFGGVQATALVVPNAWEESQIATLARAAAAGLDGGVEFVKADSCLRLAYEKRHATNLEKDETRVVAFVDVGRCAASCVVCSFTTEESCILSSEASTDGSYAGTAALDALVYDYLLTKLPKDVDKPVAGSKKGLRLLNACERLRVLLSTMDLAKVTCENLGEERDVPLELTRKELEEVCAPALKGLYHLLERAKMGAGMVVDAVELVGGGSRVCAVRNCAGEVFGTSTFGAKMDDASLAHGAALALATERDARKNVWLQREALVAAQSRTHENSKLLDEAKANLDKEEKAAAFKAREAAAEKPENGDGEEAAAPAPAADAPESTLQIRVRVLSQKADDLKAEERKVTTALNEAADVADRAAKVLATRPETDAAELRKAEDAMCERDEGVRLVAEQRNALETCILELRAAKNGSHYKLFEEKAVEFGELLQAAEDWLWSDEASNADAIAQKKEQVLADAKLLVPAYFAKVEEERLATEQELEKEAATATNEDDDDERREDRINADTRKLKFADRFRLVEKNKAEGTELFKDGNIHHAAKRYKDALGHASKLREYDLGPEDAAKTKKIKVDLHVNMALCWTKLQNNDQALKSAGEALALEPSHPKALYRRAALYEKTAKFDEAKADLKLVLKANEQDKAALALMKRVDAQLARQKAKAKKMAAKMFA